MYPKKQIYPFSQKNIRRRLPQTLQKLRIFPALSPHSGPRWQSYRWQSWFIATETGVMGPRQAELALDEQLHEEQKMGA